MFSSVSRGDEGKLLLSEDRVRETLIEGVRDYLIVWHLPLRDCVIVNSHAVTRLLGALLVEQNDEWIVGKRYMGAETLAAPRTTAPSAADPRPSIELAAG